MAIGLNTRRFLIVALLLVALAFVALYAFLALDHQLLHVGAFHHMRQLAPQGNIMGG